MDEAVYAEGAGGDGSDANSLVSTSTSSFSSALSSSDLDTESSTSFWQEKSITLGSLIGIAGDAILDNDDHVQFVAPGNGATPIHTLPRNMASRQSLCFTHTPRVCGGAKLCRLLPCGACKGLCYTTRGACKVLGCAKSGKKDVGLLPTAPSSSSLGHLLVAERGAERSMERDVDGSSNQARVYVNIMYEENTGLGQVAINPLFDLHPSSTTDLRGVRDSDQGFGCPARSQNSSREPVSSSVSAEDQPHVVLAERMSRPDSMSKYATAATGRPPLLPMKGLKRLRTSLCCVSFMWTRCRI